MSCLSLGLLVLSVDAENLDPFSIVKVALPVCEWALQEPVDLPGS
jgi:hypothetical protein